METRLLVSTGHHSVIGKKGPYPLSRTISTLYSRKIKNGSHCIHSLKLFLDVCILGDSTTHPLSLFPSPSQMWRRTGRTTPCGGRRRRHGCWKPTGRWTSTASKRTLGSSSHHSTSCYASSCPTWSTWRLRSTSRTAFSRPCPISAKRSVSTTVISLLLT